MMTLTRWNPFREMEDLQNRLSSVLGLPSVRTGDPHEQTLTVAEWTPLVDITEDEKEYLIKTDLPEVKKDDVKVSVEDRVLTITGERKFEKEEKGKKFHRVERAYGSFVRGFALPDDADETKVVAEFKEGVLKVHVAKSEQKKPTAIEVKVN